MTNDERMLRENKKSGSKKVEPIQIDLLDARKQSILVTQALRTLLRKWGGNVDDVILKPREVEGNNQERKIHGYMIDHVSIYEPLDGLVDLRTGHSLLQEKKAGNFRANPGVQIFFNYSDSRFGLNWSAFGTQDVETTKRMIKNMEIQTKRIEELNDVLNRYDTI